LAGGLVAMTSPAAWADFYGVTDCAQHPTSAACSVTAGESAEPFNSRKGAVGCRNAGGQSVPCSIPGKGWYSASYGCYFRPATPPAGETGPDWYLGTCGDPVNGFTTEFGILQQFQAAPGPEGVAQQAVSLLRLPGPRIGISPGADAVQVVHVPSWLWIADDSWAARSATASAGGVTVTAIARPARVLWSTGDGGSVVCEGPGTRWTPDQRPAAASPTCGHTFTRSSAGAGRFTVRATITWNVSWAGLGLTGTLDPLTSTTATQVRVVEAPAVNTAA
jgi:hypothetical protein